MKIGINIKIPQKWNDLSEKQLQGVASALEYYRNLPEEKQKDGFHLKKLYLHLIKELIRENNWFKVRIALRQIPPSEFPEHIQFLLNQNSRHLFSEKLKIKKENYFPPGVRMQNVKMKEFSFADSLFYNWREKKDNRYLDLLCATLYRRKKGKSQIDYRRPFEKIITEKEVVKFKKIKLSKKLAIAYAYEGSRNYIISLYPHVFPKPIESAQDPEEQKTITKPTYTPFGKLLHFKVNFDPSKIKETENLNIHEFLSIYENELAELEKQK